MADLQPLFSTPGAYNIVIDAGGTLWLGGNGLYEWDGALLLTHNQSNSTLPTDEIHGVAVDQQDTKWVGLGLRDGSPTGIMKISAAGWQYTRYSDIPALASTSYVSVECVDKDNNVWVSSFENPSGILRYDGVEWIFERTGRILCDNHGTAWSIHEDWGSDFPSTLDVASTLDYFDQGQWRSVDVSGLTRRILSLVKYQDTLVLGTVKGLAFVDDV